MKFFLLLLNVLLLYSKATNAQVEVSIGYAVNKDLADGVPIQFGYEYRILNKLNTKTQLGFKHLYHFNDFVGAKLYVDIFEIHQTISYPIFSNRSYILRPNIGINYRRYNWRGKMLPPFNSLPQRVYNLEFRDRQFLRLNSFGNKNSDTYRVSNLGFTIQIQNQFKLNDKLWLSVTPFLEPDYDRIQNTGGCYVGLIFLKL